jgi:hypothetical protein
MREIGANLVNVPGRTGNCGIKTALVDGFIFGRVEHLAQIEPARLRRLPFAVVDFDPGPSINSVRVDTRAGSYIEVLDREHAAGLYLNRRLLQLIRGLPLGDRG